MLPIGTVFMYPYLWAHEDERGRRQPAKSRPVVVIGHIGPDSARFLYLLPISTLRPLPPQSFLEIPPAEVGRAGLRRVPQFVNLAEFNLDRERGGAHIGTLVQPRGCFSNAFVRKLSMKLISDLSAGDVRVVRR